MPSPCDRPQGFIIQIWPASWTTVFEHLQIDEYAHSLEPPHWSIAATLLMSICTASGKCRTGVPGHFRLSSANILYSWGSRYVWGKKSNAEKSLFSRSSARLARFTFLTNASLQREHQNLEEAFTVITWSFFSTAFECSLKLLLTLQAPNLMCVGLNSYWQQALHCINKPQKLLFSCVPYQSNKDRTGRWRDERQAQTYLRVSSVWRWKWLSFWWFFIPVTENPESWPTAYTSALHKRSRQWLYAICRRQPIMMTGR